MKFIFYYVNFLSLDNSFVYLVIYIILIYDHKDFLNNQFLLVNYNTNFYHVLYYHPQIQMYQH